MRVCTFDYITVNEVNVVTSIDRYNEGGAVPYKTNYRPDDNVNSATGRYNQRAAEEEEEEMEGLNIGGVAIGMFVLCGWGQC